MSVIHRAQHPSPERIRQFSCIHACLAEEGSGFKSSGGPYLLCTHGILLERHVRATGVKKGHLVEQALRHHLQALQELPADVIVHSTLVVTRMSGQAILKELQKGKSSAALRRLMR